MTMNPAVNHELHPQACRLAEVGDIHCAHFKKGQLSGLAPEDVGRTMRFSVDVIVECYTLTGATPAEREAESALWRLHPFGVPTLETIPVDTVTPSELLETVKQTSAKLRAYAAKIAERAKRAKRKAR